MQMGENDSYSLCEGAHKVGHWVHKDDRIKDRCSHCSSYANINWLDAHFIVELEASSSLQSLSFPCFQTEDAGVLHIETNPILLQPGSILLLERSKSTNGQFAQIPMYKGSLQEIMLSVYSYYRCRIELSGTREEYMQTRVQGIHHVGSNYYICRLRWTTPTPIHDSS